MQPRARHRLIGEVTEMTREDMSATLGPALRQPSVAKLRDGHHRIARLAAAGLRRGEIAERTGYTPARISVLLGAPAMVELIARYREMIDEAYVDEMADEYADATATRRMAMRQRRERLEAADLGEADPIPMRDLTAIIADTEDRYGVMKKTGNINFNADFAAELEKAIARSGKVIEVAPVEGKLQRRV